MASAEHPNTQLGAVGGLSMISRLAEWTISSFKKKSIHHTTSVHSLLMLGFLMFSSKASLRVFDLDSRTY